MTRTAAQWVRLAEPYELDYSSIYDIIAWHSELHAQHSESDNEAILDVERSLSYTLRSRGIEHRHNDALAEAAGTIVKKPADPTVDEIAHYLNDTFVLEHGAVSLVQDAVDAGPIYAVMSSMFAGKTAKAILKMLNRKLPPGLVLKTMPKAVKGDFATIRHLMDLQLGGGWGLSMATTWEALNVGLRASASAASVVFKADQAPRIPFEVAKGTIKPEERYVLGIVLEPEVLDVTKANPDYTKTGAVGDIYGAIPIRGAFEWWTENQRVFEYHHEITEVVKGVEGHQLSSDDIVLLDNYTAPCDLTIEGTDVKAGTWLQGARIKNDDIWAEVQAGTLTAWSIWADAMGHMEPVAEAA